MCGIYTMGNRVVVADIQESFHFVRYKRAENQLIVFADDTNPRWITAMCLLDYDTVAGADKFGNITVVSTIFILSIRKKAWTNSVDSDSTEQGISSFRTGIVRT